MTEFLQAVLVILIIAIVVFAFLGFKIVRHSETMVIERLGRYDRILKSGINIIWPIVDRPRTVHWRYTETGPDGRLFHVMKSTPRIDLRETVYDFPRQNVITKDNVAILINALVYFQINDPMKAVYEIANLPDAIEKLTQTTLRNIIGELDLDDSLVSRDTVNKKLGIILDEATHKWGVKVNRVELQDITPPADVQHAMEKQMRAERERRAQILTAEGMKRAAILESEGVREAQIQQAEGEKQGNILRAEGEAQAIERLATAQSEALKRVAGSLLGTTDPASFLIAMKYVDTLKDISSGGPQSKLVFLPYEATGVLGALGGIRELFNATETAKSPSGGTVAGRPAPQPPLPPNA